MISNSHPPSIHDDPDMTVPAFLCRICHPELNLTDAQKMKLDAEDRERLMAESKARQRVRDIDQTQRAIASATRRGEPEPTSVSGKILVSQRKKLARLLEAA